ncbi:hypothetical protein PC117_g24361, partial [Phytophthora cactorum]
MTLEEIDVTDLMDNIPSATKWTYKIDYRNRRAVLDESGRPVRTESYEEFLVETAMKILCTERFQYVVYGADMGVEKSEWPGWEDTEIIRDIEEALTTHPEIEQAEVTSMTRVDRGMDLTIQITGLVETPDMIYQRWVNRAITMANERGLPPPPVGEGEYFYDLWYPIAQEIAEQQELWGYGVLQSTPIWADDEFLDAHGWADGMVRKDGESNDDYRLRILDRAFTEEGNGRRKDYEIWAKEIQGVGGAVAVEKEHHDNSIDLYLTDMNGQPITAEFAETVKTLMWEDYR